MFRFAFLLIGVLMLPEINWSQQPHEHPDHPKGVNSADQYEALPFYNEACEWYQNGKLERAKRSLKEAINTSFSLTEAQLFLGQIYYEQGIIDSAYIYLNSGIDFATKQKPHFYFLFFETGLALEEYDQVKHNMKHFKKWYGDVASGKYEAEYPYTVNDYERYQAAVALIFDYKNWKPSADLSKRLSIHNASLVSNLKKEVLLLQEKKAKLLLHRKDYAKWQTLGWTLKDAEHVHYCSALKGLFVSQKKEGVTSIYFVKVNGKKLENFIKLPKEINGSNWTSDAYYYAEKGLLYFSSDRSGNKDLFVAQYDAKTNTCAHVKTLERVNTPGDERTPVFDGTTFYFSSNGLPGFGGFDLYHTNHYSEEKGILVPSDWFNMGKPYNTGGNEHAINLLTKDLFCIDRSGYQKPRHLDLLRLHPAKPPTNYDIRMSELPKDSD